MVKTHFSARLKELDPSARPGDTHRIVCGRPVPCPGNLGYVFVIEGYSTVMSDDGRLVSYPVIVPDRSDLELLVYFGASIDVETPATSRWLIYHPDRYWRDADGAYHASKPRPRDRTLRNPETGRFEVHRVSGGRLPTPATPFEQHEYGLGGHSEARNVPRPPERQFMARGVTGILPAIIYCPVCGLPQNAEPPP